MSMTDLHDPRTEPQRHLRPGEPGVRTELVLLAGADEAGVRSLNEWVASYLSAPAGFTRLGHERAGALVEEVDVWALTIYDDWTELVHVLPTFGWKAPDEVFLYVNEDSRRPPVVFCCTGRYRLPMIPR